MSKKDGKPTIEDFTQVFPPIGKNQMELHISRLERMANFYQNKIPIAPVKQSSLFKGYFNTLMYAITVIRLYKDLTAKLAGREPFYDTREADNNEGNNNEAGPDSTSR